MATIQEAWQRLIDRASGGQKAHLTRMKNHYIAVVRDDPEGAAMMLALYEHQFGLIDK